jgi:undecaprenyl-diphosphatase
LGIGDAVILGILQGLTEFLPVSSSGHLVLGKALLGIAEQGIAFEVFVHFGTLLAVLTIFRNDVWQLLISFLSLFSKSTFKSGIEIKYENDENFRLLVFILVATIPAVIVGLLLEDYVESAFNNPKVVGVTLILTAIILLLTLVPQKTLQKLNMKNTFIMGLAQAMAILPGISRSGSTISFGILFNISGNDAARFSFLLAIPAILGATILKVTDLFETGIDKQFFIVLLVGTVASYISGYIAIESLLKIVQKGKLYLFAPYCLVLGIIALLFI